MALQVLHSQMVDCQTWADAAKWLILCGPPAIKQILLQASASAASQSFPDLKPAGFNEDGDPHYDLVDLAEALGADPEILHRSLTNLEEEAESLLGAAEEDIRKIQ